MIFFLYRLGLSLAVMLGTGIAAALVLTILNLYLSGHGHDFLLQEIITWDAGGVRLSPGDLIMLAAALLSGGLIWYLTGRAR